MVTGDVEPAFQEKYDKAAKRTLGRKGFALYSRVKLWDEAQLVGKTPAQLTGVEFAQALHNIDVYFKMPATLIG